MKFLSILTALALVALPIAVANESSKENSLSSGKGINFVRFSNPKDETVDTGAPSTENKETSNTPAPTRFLSEPYLSPVAQKVEDSSSEEKSDETRTSLPMNMKKAPAAATAFPTAGPKWGKRTNSPTEFAPIPMGHPSKSPKAKKSGNSTPYPTSFPTKPPKKHKQGHTDKPSNNEGTPSPTLGGNDISKETTAPTKAPKSATPSPSQQEALPEETSTPSVTPVAVNSEPTSAPKVEDETPEVSSPAPTGEETPTSSNTTDSTEEPAVVNETEVTSSPTDASAAPGPGPIPSTPSPTNGFVFIQLKNFTIVTAESTANEATHNLLAVTWAEQLAKGYRRVYKNLRDVSIEPTRVEQQDMGSSSKVAVAYSFAGNVAFATTTEVPTETAVQNLQGSFMGKKSALWLEAIQENEEQLSGLTINDLYIGDTKPSSPNSNDEGKSSGIVTGQKPGSEKGITLESDGPWLAGIAAGLITCVGGCGLLACCGGKGQGDEEVVDEDEDEDDEEEGKLINRDVNV